MYAVIFRATMKHPNEQYERMAVRLRSLAFSKYRCIDFVTSLEGNKEIAISYWHNQEDIQKWHQDPLHKEAQRLGKDTWYHDYNVEVVELKRRYSSEGEL
ncbi:antibiotic biosynthesis monooxygenase family protein [Vibrio sp. E150_011]